MKKKVLFAALSALALAACVNDETIEMNPGNAVGFRASTENSTRAAVTTSSTLQDFKVWGYYNYNSEYTSFMEGQEVSKAGNEWVYSPVRFWPTWGEVDFYSVSPADVTTNITKDAQQILDYTVNTDPSKQIDLLYAVNMGCDDRNSKNGIPVNFRHALSQVVFKAKTINPSIEVEIESIKLNDIMGTGTFTFPTETTTAIGYPNTYEEAVEDGTFGQWELSKDYGDLKKYTVILDQAKTVPTDGSTIDLTTTDNGVLLLMPQILAENEYTYDNGGNSETVSESPSLSIKCRIYNVSGDEKVQVFGSSNNFSTLEDIPFEGTWQQGRKYTYTLIFGEELGDLKKVNFTTSVDEFQSPLNENTNIQQPLNGVNMDADVTTYGGGNCFVIPKSDTETIRYYFDPTKEGQTDDPIGTTVTPSDHARKAMLMDENTEGMLTDIAYYPEEQKIAFNIEKGKTGNAIVAITDGVDNVLWSWHIWVTEDNAFMTETQQGEFMDRNLGAKSKATADGDHDDLGVYYQYGRHTPALVYGTSSHEIIPARYANTLQISHKFIKSRQIYWMLSSAEVGDEDLWSSTNRAKYSPAPKGWKVASTDELANSFKNAARNNKLEVVKDDDNKVLHMTIKGEEGKNQVFYRNKTMFYNSGNIGAQAVAPIVYFGAHQYGKNAEVQISETGENKPASNLANGHNLRLIKE